MSEVKVNTITPRSGTTLTLGGSGDTVTLAACASQSGFGRTGTVDWCTTAKTSPFTAATGKGYFVNTCGGVVTVTLPGSSTAGDIVSIADYKSTWQTNNVTLCRNSQKINGGTNNAVLSTEGQSITLVYVDGTQGWKNTMDSTSNVTGEPAYVTASGGTESTSGDYKIHKFTSDGNFVVSAAGTPSGSTKVSYMVVAGGGGGGGDYGSGAAGAGGGGGGYREGKCTSDPYTASPLKAPDGLTVSVQTYPISVGAGGPFGNAPPSPDQSGQPGGNSIFSTITSTGGGGGGEGYRNSTANGKPGGSGGGAGSSNLYTSTVGTGNTPPVSPAQGNDGGTMYGTPPVYSAGGGGGASAAGGNAPPSTAGAGGAGTTSSISATPTAYAGGGGGGSTSTAAAGGPGGGGAGNTTSPGTAGTTNTGGGGGGAGHPPSSSGGAGGSGIVILRYKYQN